MALEGGEAVGLDLEVADVERRILAGTDQRVSDHPAPAGILRLVSLRRDALPGEVREADYPAAVGVAIAIRPIHSLSFRSS